MVPSVAPAPLTSATRAVAGWPVVSTRAKFVRMFSAGSPWLTPWMDAVSPGPMARLAGTPAKNSPWVVPRSSEACA